MVIQNLNEASRLDKTWWDEKVGSKGQSITLYITETFQKHQYLQNEKKRA